MFYLCTIGCKNQLISANMELAKLHKDEKGTSAVFLIGKSHETNIIVRNRGDGSESYYSCSFNFHFSLEGKAGKCKVYRF